MMVAASTSETLINFTAVRPRRQNLRAHREPQILPGSVAEFSHGVKSRTRDFANSDQSTARYVRFAYILR